MTLSVLERTYRVRCHGKVNILAFMWELFCIELSSCITWTRYYGNRFQIYPYLVVNDPCMTESRREERVLQLLRMSNHFLVKHKVEFLCVCVWLAK